MRTRQSIKNIMAAMISYAVTVTFGFVARSFFVKLLGEEYLGINSLFSNIISVMSVVELGFGSAIIYNLYRPLSNGDSETVKSLIQFYKIVYRIISGIVFVFGVLLLPFIPHIVGAISVTENVCFIFILFVIDAAVSYLLTYKRSLLYADQRNYVVNLLHAILYAFINFAQILTLILYQNYILYLLIQIGLHIIENVIISFGVNRSYAYIRERAVQRLNRRVRNDIIQKVKGLLFHQIGSSIVMGTDNIIISMTSTLGIVAVGKYSNYTMIINNLNSLTSQVFSSVTASVGNLLVEKTQDESYCVYKRILFLNAMLCNFVCVSVYCIMEPFISIWLGCDFILSKSVLAVLTINFYVQGMKRTCGLFKNAAGVFYEDRYVPLVEAIANLISSVIFVKLFGHAGVCLGTVLSSGVHWLYDFPIYVYQNIFQKSIKNYTKDYFQFVFVFLGALVVTSLISLEIEKWSNDLFARLVLSVIFSCIIPNMIFFLSFMKKEEFRYWYQLCTYKFKRSRNWRESR